MKSQLWCAVLGLSLAGVMSGCQTTAQDQTASSTTGSVAQAGDASLTQTKTQMLQSYVWTHQASDSPTAVVLRFQDGRVAIDAGCNGMGTDVQIDDQIIKAGNVISTMKACAPEIMKQEQMAGKLFANRDVPYDLDLANLNKPVLILTTTEGQKLRFTSQPTAETKYQGQAEIQFLEIAPETKQCSGVGVMQCMQVREIKYQDGKKIAVGDWSNFYGQIEGYQHQDGIRNIVRVKRFTLKNPAADQSKYAYVHDLTVEAEQVK
ncbi:META domain-containing protein [Acinetobacter marinus]|uniref:META domain-containing protein n=1 Tax=Acinetobacter marinus TaxID=281375 RepID=A0A1G6JVW8_9GAMM|nr:DUF4377 domain-containing protein [Acinetobacter marinus]SDC22854.1 META domain-containing protein [Acinetobacter marinus]